MKDGLNKYISKNVGDKKVLDLVIAVWKEGIKNG